MTSPGNFKPTKKLPAPYSRPSISIGGSETKKREWKYATVMDIREGDIIADLGLVHDIEYVLHDDTIHYVLVVCGEAKTPIKFEAGVLLKTFS